MNSKHKQLVVLPKKTILVLGPSLDAVSGVSTHVKLLLNSDLINSYQLGHFLVGSEGLNESRLDKFYRLITSPARLAFRIVRDKVSIIHLNTSIDKKAFWRDLVYLAVAKLLGRTVIYQVHGGQLPEEFAQSSKLVLKAMQWAVFRADKVVLLTREEQQAYANYFPGLGVKLVPNAISVEQRVRTKWSNEGEPLKLVYISRLIETKGLKDSLEAISVLIRQGRRLMLTIAGAGPFAKDLELYIQNLSLNGVVQIIGPIFGDAKNELWQSSDVFLFPTYHKEGLPYALLEAMSYGVVPITTRVGAIPDVVTDGEGGLLVPTRDPVLIASAIRKIDEDRSLLKCMGAVGQRVIWERYSVTRLARDFASVYEEVLTERV